jgi:hypothetical protein
MGPNRTELAGLCRYREIDYRRKRRLLALDRDD